MNPMVNCRMNYNSFPIYSEEARVLRTGMHTISLSYKCGKPAEPTVASTCAGCATHVPLVSRRFSEACRDPSLWPELRVLHAAFSTEARWRSFLRWLAARGSGLRTLVFIKWEVWP